MKPSADDTKGGWKNELAAAEDVPLIKGFDCSTSLILMLTSFTAVFSTVESSYTHMITEAQFVALQTATIEQVLLTVLQGLVVVGFLGVSVLAAHLLVQAFRTENGEFRIRDARLMLAGAGVLFVTGFTSLVVTDGVSAGSLAGVALGFAGVTYLLYTARPELFTRFGRDGTSASTDRPID